MSARCFARGLCPGERLLSRLREDSHARRPRPRRDSWNRVEGVPPVRQVAREDCGAAALAMVLGYWGCRSRATRSAAASRAAPERGIRAAALRDFARRQGLQAFVIQGELADLDRELRAAPPGRGRHHETLRAAPYPHYEVVVGIDRAATAHPHARSRARTSREQPRRIRHRVGRRRPVTLVVFPRPRPPSE